jgi:hypothetical protein
MSRRLAAASSINRREIGYYAGDSREPWHSSQYRDSGRDVGTLMAYCEICQGSQNESREVRKGDS